MMTLKATLTLCSSTKSHLQSLVTPTRKKWQEEMSNMGLQDAVMTKKRRGRKERSFHTTKEYVVKMNVGTSFFGVCFVGYSYSGRRRRRE